MHHSLDDYVDAAESLKRVLPSGYVPEFGIICGSGLSGLQEAVTGPKIEVSFSDIKGFPISTVPGHAGVLSFGFIGALGTPVVLMSGRTHYYEGYELQKTTFHIRVMKLLGIKTCIITNAAGGLDPSYKVGDVVLINDHINFPGLAGVNPLRGPNLDHFGPRFIALSDAYDLELRRVAHLAWKETAKHRKKGMEMHEGIYAFVGGPNYETRAECRMLAKLGADLVGMSTVPEIIAARHCGLRVLALSLVTNNAVMGPAPHGNDPRLEDVQANELLKMLGDGKANHEEVLETSKGAADEVKHLVIKIIEKVSQHRKISDALSLPHASSPSVS